MEPGSEVGVEQTFAALVPPWAALSAVLGTMHGAMFHLLFGGHIGRLPVAVVIALLASLAGGLVGTMIPPSIVAVGDTNLIATGLGAWMALGAARALRFV